MENPSDIEKINLSQNHNIFFKRCNNDCRKNKTYNETGPDKYEGICEIIGFNGTADRIIMSCSGKYGQIQIDVCKSCINKFNEEL